jgi:uncharacterized membrane protein YfcA
MSTSPWRDALRLGERPLVRARNVIGIAGNSALAEYGARERRIETFVAPQALDAPSHPRSFPLLLLHTPSDAFDHIVPWLVLGATALFLAQRPLLRLVRGTRVPAGDALLASSTPSAGLLGAQFVVGVYGGYFGAGIGILMLAALGLMGFTNIHRMNGLKNWGGFCMNLVAALTFAASDIVRWPVALAMALGSVTGGYVGARAAQRVSQEVVRGAVAAVGVLSGLWLLVRMYAGS